MLNLEKFNQAVQQWGSETAHNLQTAGSAMGIQHRGSDIQDGNSIKRASTSPRASLDAIAARFRQSDGMVNVVSFRFPRSLIWAHKGAGKGMGGTKGSTWVDQYGTTRKTSTKSLGRAGSGSRTPKPFFDTTLNSPTGIDALGDIVTETLGDALVNNLLINK